MAVVRPAGAPTSSGSGGKEEAKSISSRIGPPPVGTFFRTIIGAVSESFELDFDALFERGLEALLDGFTPMIEGSVEQRLRRQGTVNVPETVGAKLAIHRAVPWKEAELLSSPLTACTV